MFSEYSKHDVAVYAGYIDNSIKLMQSTSGGIATALSEFMIHQGGYVAGVAYSEDLYKAEYILTNNLVDLELLKGSKYIDCDKNNIFLEIKNIIDSDKKVLFFGLPCIIAALYKYIGSRPKNLLTCELVCHGPTHPKVHKDYIDFLEKKFKSKVIDFSVRHKKSEWMPAYLYAKFDNGKVFEKLFNKTEYGIAFSILSRESCYSCKFKGNNRTGDIMIGDFWGASNTDDYWNKFGVSVIFAETGRGNQFLKATPGIKLFPTTFEKAVENNQMVIKSRSKPVNKELFSKLLSEKGLIYAAKHSFSLKMKLKRIIHKYFPNTVKNFLIKVYHLIIK